MAKQAKTQKKSVLDWLVPVICIVVVIGALIGILIGPIQKRIDNNTVLIESENGEVVVKRPMAQTITWLQLVQSFQQSYSNYSIYKYYKSIFGDGIDLSSIISDSEISWMEQNIAYMNANLGLNFYTQVDVSSGAATSEDVENSAVAFAVYMASGVKTNFGSYFTSTLESVKHYASIGAAAKSAGVTLDDEDRANIEESMESLRDLASAISYNGSLKKFIKEFIGDAVKESTVTEAYELMALASKYNTMISNQNYDAATASDLSAYVEENKDEFYTAKYLKYVTENPDLVELLEAATDKDSFIAVAAKEIMDKRYAAVIAEWEQSHLLQGENLPELVEEEIASAGFGELITYEKGVNDPETALADAIYTDEERSSNLLYLVEGTENVYLVWFKSASAGKSEVRLKAFPYGGLESYDDIADFRQSVYLDVLTSLKEGSTTYTDRESLAYMEAVDELLKAVEEAAPSETSASYKADAEKDSFEEWISSSTRKAGDIRKSETKEDGSFKSCEFVLVLSPMALDKETTVHGGYIEYETEDAANEGKEKLSGKTGIELISAMQDLSDDAMVGTAIKEGDFDEEDEDLKNWFFSSDRKNGDVAILTGSAEKTETDENGEETTVTKTVYYLVCFRSTQEAWVSYANTSFASDKTNDWVEALEKTLKVNEKALVSFGVDLEEAEHDHSAD